MSDHQYSHPSICLSACPLIHPLNRIQSSSHPFVHPSTFICPLTTQPFTHLSDLPSFYTLPNHLFLCQAYIHSPIRLSIHPFCTPVLSSVCMYIHLSMQTSVHISIHPSHRPLQIQCSGNERQALECASQRPSFRQRKLHEGPICHDWLLLGCVSICFTSCLIPCVPRADLYRRHRRHVL